MAIRVFHSDKPDLMLPIIAKDARLVVWPGVGAQTANMNYVRMEPGEANVPHIHAESEDTIYILEGAARSPDFDHRPEVWTSSRQGSTCRPASAMPWPPTRAGRWSASEGRVRRTMAMLKALAPCPTCFDPRTSGSNARSTDTRIFPVTACRLIE